MPRFWIEIAHHAVGSIAQLRQVRGEITPQAPIWAENPSRLRRGRVSELAHCSCACALLCDVFELLSRVVAVDELADVRYS